MTAAPSFRMGRWVPCSSSAEWALEGCLDRLNLTHPALVADIHRAYIDAGAQIIQTNTFGANRYKLSRHSLHDSTAEINRAGVDLARRVVMASFKEILIAGDIGPLGVRLAPFGRVQPEEARKIFREQIEALATAGVDLLIIETMTDLLEISEAVAAAHEVAPHLPVIASMTFTRDDRTLLGDSPARAAQSIAATGATVIGANCASGPNQLLRILRQMRQAVPDGKFSIMPNAGFPEQVGGRVQFSAPSEYFGEFALRLWQAGASVLGGCCGTTPEHISVISKAIQAAPLESIMVEPATTAAPGETPALSEAEQPSRLAQKLERGEFVAAVEMDPPRGLSTHKLMAGASLLADSGADVINVADSPMARMRMSPWAVCSLIQRKIGVETTLHFPTRGRNLLRVQGDLLASHAIGVRNVFVVMGDPTAIGDYPGAMDSYDLVPSGLVKLIKQSFNAGRDHAGNTIGQPTSFFVGCALNLNPPNLEKEIQTLRRKLEAGADFLLSQPIYTLQPLERFLEQYEKTCGKLKVPLLLGILPLASARHAIFMQHEVPGVIIPPETMERMEKAGANESREGIKIALELIEKARPLVQGLYLMPAFSRFDHAAEIIEAVKK